MKTAGDAKLIANDYWDREGEKIISSILSEIKEHAVMGKYSCIINGLDDKHIEGLKALGFGIKFRSYKPLCHEISW